MRALYWQLNDEFHLAVYRGADNRSILQLTDNMRSRLMPVPGVHVLARPPNAGGISSSTGSRQSHPGIRR